MVIINESNFGKVAHSWMKEKKPQLKPSSIAKYSNILSLYLVPQFGNRIINEISRSDVMGFTSSLLINGGVDSDTLSPKTVNDIISVLKNIFEYYSKENGLRVANINDISIKQPQKPMRILSLFEQRKLNNYLFSNLNPCNLGILTSLYTGIRIGEVCALRWEDICIDERYLYIHNTMQRIQIESNSERKTQVIIQTPKSECSIRKIPIPSELFRLMIDYQKANDAFFLTGLTDKYIEPRCMENRFKSIADKCNINQINFHALRHTFATRCVELGFDIKSLSEILGHASVNITLNRYVHPSMELKQKNMDMLSSVFSVK